MKTQIFILLAVVSILVCNVRADLIWDSGHHELTEGSHTFVEMYDQATANIIGGWIAELLMYDETSVIVEGGEIMSLVFGGQTIAKVYDGADVRLLRPNDNAIATVYGGSVQTVFSLGSSQTNIYAGVIDELDAVDSSKIILHVEPDYVYVPNAGTYNDGLITGQWWNTDQSFAINLVGADSYGHVTFVPEPCTLALLFLGGLIVKRVE